ANEKRGTNPRPAPRDHSDADERRDHREAEVEGSCQVAVGPTAARGVRHARAATYEEGDGPQGGSGTSPQHADEHQKAGHAPEPEARPRGPQITLGAGRAGL